MAKTSTASDILDEARSYDRKQDELIFDLYKLILADEWHELSERERRNYLKRMFYAVYGAYNQPELFQVLNKAKQTDIYQWGEEQELL